MNNVKLLAYISVNFITGNDREMNRQTHWVTVNWTLLLESEAETKIRQLQILLLIRLISAERQVDIMIHLKTRTLSITYETQTPQITNL